MGPPEVNAFSASCVTLPVGAVGVVAMTLSRLMFPLSEDVKVNATVLAPFW